MQMNNKKKKNVNEVVKWKSYTWTTMNCKMNCVLASYGKILISID